MQRINKKTNLPFQQGDKKPGGWVFDSYLSTLDKRGCFKELWLKPTKHDSQRGQEYKLMGRLKRLLSAAKTHSKGRGHDDPELTIEDLFELWAEQKGCCAYSGLPLSIATGDPLVVSIDRIDNAIGYTKDNITLVCWAINDAKGTHSYEFFVKLCICVANHPSNKSINSKFVSDLITITR